MSSNNQKISTTERVIKSKLKTEPPPKRILSDVNCRGSCCCLFHGTLVFLKIIKLDFRLSWSILFENGIYANQKYFQLSISLPVARYRPYLLTLIVGLSLVRLSNFGSSRVFVVGPTARRVFAS